MNLQNINFLARGGEVYYLHLLQGIDGNKGKKEELEVLLDDLVNRQCKKISKLAGIYTEYVGRTIFYG